jgi:hypothetical protein
MAYPAAIHSYTAVDGTTLVTDAGHAAMHNAVGSAVTQIETTIGTNSGTAVLKNFTVGNFAAKQNNDTFGTPTILGGTIGTALIGTSTIQGGTVNSKIGLLTNGTIGTTLVGTSTIQGGTANSVLVNTSDLRGFYCTPQYATCSGTGGTTTLDLSLTNEWRVTFGTANGTLAVTGGVDGQKFIVSLTQDAVGTRTMVWFDTVKWPGNGTPALTVTAAKRDTFGFIKTGAATFDGFTVGLNS